MYSFAPVFSRATLSHSSLLTASHGPSVLASPPPLRGYHVCTLLLMCHRFCGMLIRIVFSHHNLVSDTHTFSVHLLHVDGYIHCTCTLLVAQLVVNVGDCGFESDNTLLIYSFWKHCCLRPLLFPPDLPPADTIPSQAPSPTHPPSPALCGHTLHGVDVTAMDLLCRELL